MIVMLSPSLDDCLCLLLPLKLSAVPFCHGLSGSISAMPGSFFSAQRPGNKLWPVV